MASEEEPMSPGSGSTGDNKKRQRKTSTASIAASQNCIAAAMAGVISNMANPMLKNQCMLMLQVEDSSQLQGKILHLLQKIDFNILEEQEKMDKAKKAAAERKATKK